MSIFDDFRQLKASHDQFGPRRFWLIMAGALLFVVLFVSLGVWLQMGAHWPRGCDHEGRRLIGMVKQLYCSPSLLAGTGKDIGLFLWLWFVPAVLAGLLVYVLVKKRGRSTISDSDSTE